MRHSHEQMNIVIVGHVDHGKSTFIGRLLADTGSLPQGKLEQVKAMCAANARPFEYAFLLDALKDEQAQGITIDTARSFFKSDKRHYIIIDAPGHIEFLKNMITGASRAEAALLLIDAEEGVQENSRRHGYMMSLLGIKKVIVLINKMDLVDYSQDRFNEIKAEYTQFLSQINLNPIDFVPISAREGDNLISPSEKMPWYNGLPVLSQMDALEKEKDKSEADFRFPVQDIYKFTAQNDDRRIVAGNVTSGSIQVGEKVVFYPSLKESEIKSVEGFNLPVQTDAHVGQATGFTLKTQIYIRPGEVMCKKSEPPMHSGTSFKGSIFWLGRKPLVTNKKYKLKLGTQRLPVYVKEIVSAMDASSLDSSTARQINRHDVGEVILQTNKPLAFDLAGLHEFTSRFVIIDDYEIAGGGIITETIDEDQSHLDDWINRRQFAFEESDIPLEDRIQKWGQKPTLVVLAGPDYVSKIKLAKSLEKSLFDANKNTFYLGVSNRLLSLDHESGAELMDRDEHIRRIGYLAHMFCNSGQILVSTVTDLDDSEAEILKKLVNPHRVLVVSVGEYQFQKLEPDLSLDLPENIEEWTRAIHQFLFEESILTR